MRMTARELLRTNVSEFEAQGLANQTVSEKDIIDCDDVDGSNSD